MVTAFVVIFTVALIVMAGLVLDGGLALSAKVQAIDDAQAAARAGAQAIDIPLYRSTGQITLDPAQATADAERYLADAGHTGTVAVDRRAGHRDRHHQPAHPDPRPGRHRPPHRHGHRHGHRRARRRIRDPPRPDRQRARRPGAARRPGRPASRGRCGTSSAGPSRTTFPSAAQVGRALNRQGIPDQPSSTPSPWSSGSPGPSSSPPSPSKSPPPSPDATPPTSRSPGSSNRSPGASSPRSSSPASPSPPARATPAPGGATAGGPLCAARRRAGRHAVLTDATLTARTGPDTAAVATTAATQPPAPHCATSPPADADTYVVQRGDTLWGIAERELGDPLRWSEIYQLNEGRPQPGGVTLTDPHWIDPGWTLVLPATLPHHRLCTPPANAPTSPPEPTATDRDRRRPPPSPPPTTPTTSTPAAPTHPASTHHDHYHPSTASTRAEPVRLPSGSVVAGSFAAGVVATVAIGRLRRRHAYRYRPPRPGRDLTPPPLRPTLDRLTHASQDGTVEPESQQRRRRSSVSVQRRRAPPATRTSGDRHP